MCVFVRYLFICPLRGTNIYTQGWGGWGGSISVEGGGCGDDGDGEEDDVNIANILVIKLSAGPRFLRAL